MPSENILTTAIARVARVPFWLTARQPVFAPRKALILKPCCLSQVMLTTPLLAALHKAYPDGRFDWAVSEWARPAIIGNPRLTEVITTGSNSLNNQSWSEIQELVMRLREERYDTCFIPSRSSLLSLVAWWARIPQRIGLHVNGRGFAHTTAVRPPRDTVHEAEILLSLAAATGVDQPTIDSVGMEFYPADSDRTAVTQRIINSGWLGVSPLVVIHPGGAQNPTQILTEKQWPLERYVLLASQIARKHHAKIVLTGGASERSLANDIVGMLTTPVLNLAGELNLSEFGALCEVATLFVGNDSSPMHIAAAMGCKTVAIFGPSNPAISQPYATRGQVVALWKDVEERPYSWENGISVKDVMQAITQLLS